MPVRFRTEQQEREFAIDDKYQYLIDEYKWQLNCHGYLKRGIGKSGTVITVLAHRQILELEGYNLTGLDVDHINGNPLDNRVKNLRACTHSQNQHNKGKNKNNKSGFKGVSWNKRSKLWRSDICADKKRIFLGYYKCPKEASEAYLAAARKYHGEFSFENRQALA